MFQQKHSQNWHLGGRFPGHHCKFLQVITMEDSQATKILDFQVTDCQNETFSCTYKLL